MIADLVEYAGHEILLSARQKDGASLRDHLESVHRQTGVMPDQLKPVDIPECLIYLWHWFCELSGARGYGEMGPRPLQYSEIQAWSHLTKTDPTAWEIEAIKRIDSVYLSESMRKK